MESTFHVYYLTRDTFAAAATASLLLCLSSSRHLSSTSCKYYEKLQTAIYNRGVAKNHFKQWKCLRTLPLPISDCDRIIPNGLHGKDQTVLPPSFFIFSNKSNTLCFFDCCIKASSIFCDNTSFSASKMSRSRWCCWEKKKNPYYCNHSLLVKQTKIIQYT